MSGNTEKSTIPPLFLQHLLNEEAQCPPPLRETHLSAHSAVPLPSYPTETKLAPPEG